MSPGSTRARRDASYSLENAQGAGAIYPLKDRTELSGSSMENLINI